MIKPWFVYWNKNYNGLESNFIKNYDEVPSVEVFLKNFKNIKSDVENIIQKRNGNLLQHGLKDMYDNGGWETLSFINWGIKIRSNLSQSKTIEKIIDDNPNILSISINKLKPNASIKPHCGDTNAIYRGHLGINIPDSLPKCGFKVNNESRAWKEGEILLFCDAYTHQAWNNTSKERIIISFDIIRNKFEHKKKHICLRVRAFLLFQLLLQKITFLKKVPKQFQYCIFYLIYFLLIFLFPYQNKNGMILKHD